MISPAPHLHISFLANSLQHRVNNTLNKANVPVRACPRVKPSTAAAAHGASIILTHAVRAKVDYEVEARGTTRLIGRVLPRTFSS